MKAMTILVSLSLLAGCAAPAKDIQVKDIQGSELKYVETDSIDKILVKNAEAFRHFDKVILFATQFDKLKISAETNKKTAQSWNKSTWKEMDEICQHLDDFAHKKFRDGREFVPANRGGTDVLAIQFSLIDFMPYSNRHRDAGMGTVGISSSNSGIGQVTIRGVLANAKTGELVAIIENTLEINARNVSNGNLAAMYDGNSKAAHNLAWRSSFRRFLDSLHDELTRLKYAQVAM
jgi:hypothetical protein